MSVSRSAVGHGVETPSTGPDEGLRRRALVFAVGVGRFVDDEPDLPRPDGGSPVARRRDGEPVEPLCLTRRRKLVTACGDARDCRLRLGCKTVWFATRPVTTDNGCSQPGCDVFECVSPSVRVPVGRDDPHMAGWSRYCSLAGSPTANSDTWMRSRGPVPSPPPSCIRYNAVLGSFRFLQ